MLRGIGSSLVQNTLHAYTGGRYAWHLLAAALTALLVITGFDWQFFVATRSDYLAPIIFAAGIGGFFVPVAVPVVLYIVGGLMKNARLTHASFAGAQAVVIAWGISSFYKAFTGRIEPEFLMHVLDDRSRTFNFGFLEYGIFWGWPSSHTAVAFALATALTVVFSKNAYLRVLVFAYAFFIAFGAAVGFHWFSDVLAGAIVGSLVGTVVGRSFLSRSA